MKKLINFLLIGVLIYTLILPTETYAASWPTTPTIDAKGAVIIALHNLIALPNQTPGNSLGVSLFQHKDCLFLNTIATKTPPTFYSERLTRCCSSHGIFYHCVQCNQSFIV